MRTVRTVEELQENLNTIDSYIQSKHDPEYSYALDLIKHGICFISREVEGQLRFYPSRFIGYVGNTMNRHENNADRDGGETNPAISIICKTKCVPNAEQEKKYKSYCEELGFEAGERGPFGVERKFWPVLN